MSRFFLLAAAFMASAAWGHVSAPITVLAGSGVPGWSDGAGVAAKLDSPTVLSLDSSGPVLWVDDEGNTLIRSVRLDAGTDVGTLHLDRETQEAVANTSEIVSFPGDGHQSRLAVLCRQGRRIVELVGLSTTVRSRVLYSGKAISQLAYFGRQNLFMALEGVGGRLVRAPYSPTRKLNFSGALEGLKFSAFTCDGNTLVAYRQGTPSKLFFFRAVTASELTKTSELDLSDQFQGHGPLRVAYAAFDDGETKTYFWEPGGTALFWLDGNQFRLLPIPNADGSDVNNSSSAGHHPYLRLSGFAVDETRRALYLSDTPDNRVIKLRDYDYDRFSWDRGSSRMPFEFAYPQAKPPDVRRVLLYGSSYSFFSIRDVGKFYGVTKRLEYYLNLKSMAASKPYGFEVFCDGRTMGGLGYDPDILSRAISRVTDTAKVYQADTYMVVLNPQDLFVCALSYLNNPLNARGVPVGGFDPEYFINPPTTRYKGLALEFYNEIAGHASDYAPGIALDSAGHLTCDTDTADLYRHYGHNRFTGLLEACTNTLLEVLSQKIQGISPGATLFVVLGPQRNFLGFQEVSKEARYRVMKQVADYDWQSFEALNKDPHVVFFNIDGLLKPESLSYYPVFLDDDHMDYGTNVVGYLTAELLWPYVSAGR